MAITTNTQLDFQDWQECRKTIGRLDQILEDLRKYGFSIITGLLTAGAFLGKTSTTDSNAVIFIAVVVLVTALFSVDTYYQVLLSGAAERALDLENDTNPPIRVTKHISENATKSGISFIILALYIVLLLTAEGLGLFVAQALNLAFDWRGPWRWILCVGIGIVFVGILVAFCYRNSHSFPGWLPTIIVGVGLPALTIALATFLLSSRVANPVGMRPCIVFAGMFLALYIQYYWLYCAWRSGLHRQKERTWQVAAVPAA